MMDIYALIKDSPEFRGKGTNHPQVTKGVVSFNVSVTLAYYWVGLPLTFFIILYFLYI